VTRFYSDDHWENDYDAPCAHGGAFGNSAQHAVSNRLSRRVFLVDRPYIIMGALRFVYLA